jgi:2TM domain
MTHEDASSEAELRRQAIRSLKKKQDFRLHVLVYVLVNALLVGIWAATGAGFFWPVFPIIGWGIALALNARETYGRRSMSEDRIRREAERLRRG